jgi:hypothetical protein
MQTQPLDPFEYLSNHWAHLLGWSALITFLYRVYLGFKKVAGLGESIEATRLDLAVIKTNHLTHLQAEVEEVNKNLTGLREDLKTGFTELRADLRVVLGRME